MAKGLWKPQMKSGTDFAEIMSGLQKTIRRGMEREALVLAWEMFESNYHAAIARRLQIVVVEDIGLANPQLVAQVHTLCTCYLLVKKEVKRPVEPLALIQCIIMMCRSPKNRECDDAQIVVDHAIKSGKTSAAKVIEEHETFIADRHTDRGRARLRKQATESGKSYEEVATEEFLTIGAQLCPLVEINNNPWGREVREIFGLDYDRYKDACETTSDSENDAS